LIDRNAIEQDLRVFAAQAAHKHRRELTGCPGLHDGETGHFAERIRDAVDLFLLEILRENHANGRGRIFFRNRNARRADDDLCAFSLRQSRRSYCILAAADDWRSHKQNN
jgi:hypothetical protein